MALKRKPPLHENHERWLVSYADFITLLFAFFVVMFASSQTDRSRAKQVSESVQRALSEGVGTQARAAVARVLGGTVSDTGQGNAMMKGPGGAQKVAEQPPSDTVELLPTLKLLSNQLESDIQDGKLEINLQSRGLVVSLKQATFFSSGTDEIDRRSYDTIQKLADALKVLPNQIRFEGHTDAMPIHNAAFASNWELSCARSLAMLHLFSERFGVLVNRLAAAGYADTVPVAANDSESGRARNRRVDIVILNQLGRMTDAKVASENSRKNF